MIFGPIESEFPYLWKAGKGARPLGNEMGITHQGRSEAVNRALTDFGIEESFAQAAKRFEEHCKYHISVSSVSRVTKQIAMESSEYVGKKLAMPIHNTENRKNAKN